LRAAVTVADLNAWVVEQLRNKDRARPPFTNGHMVPQHLYIFGADGKRQVLDDDFANFRARYGIVGCALEHVNESEMRHFHTSDLTPTTRQLIAEKYREDFVRFGYAMYLD